MDKSAGPAPGSKAWVWFTLANLLHLIAKAVVETKNAFVVCQMTNLYPCETFYRNEISHYVGLFSINSSAEELNVQVNNDTASNQQLGTLEYSHSKDLIGRCHCGGRSSRLTPQLWCGRRVCLVYCHDDGDKLGIFWVTGFFLCSVMIMNRLDDFTDVCLNEWTQNAIKCIK